MAGGGWTAVVGAHVWLSLLIGGDHFLVTQRTHYNCDCLAFPPLSCSPSCPCLQALLPALAAGSSQEAAMRTQVQEFHATLQRRDRVVAGSYHS